MAIFGQPKSVVFSPHICVTVNISMILNCPVHYYGFADYALSDWNIKLADPVENCKFKMAAIPVLLQGNKVDFFLDPSCMPSDAPPDRQTPYIDLSEFDFVVLSDNEYASADDIRKAVARHKIKNYVVSLGALWHNETVDESCMVHRPWWPFLTVNTNTYQDTSGTNKPYMFDVLLGSRRWHRDFVLKEFIQSNLVDQNVITYRNLLKVQDVAEYNRTNNQNFPEVKIPYPWVNKNYDSVWDRPLSTNISWDLYRHTNYSIVTETLFEGPTVFVTEKVAKPIVAERLFIVFSVDRYLQRLHEMGFQTFDSVIDESYDLEPKLSKRLGMAMDQVRYLHTQDPDKIKEKILPIVKHNHLRLIELQQQTHQRMEHLLRQHIPAEFIA